MNIETYTARCAIAKARDEGASEEAIAEYIDLLCKEVKEDMPYILRFDFTWYYFHGEAGRDPDTLHDLGLALVGEHNESLVKPMEGVNGEPTDQEIEEFITYLKEATANLNTFLS